MTSRSSAETMSRSRSRRSEPCAMSSNSSRSAAGRAMKPHACPDLATLCGALALVAFAFSPARSPAQTNPAWLAGSLPKDEPQAIYADDPLDCWNRIFHSLFTRTLKVRLSDDFPEGAPFTFNKLAGWGGKGVSTRVFERIESGDRAVEPLYPHKTFEQDTSTAQLLAEPRFSEFQKALTEALAEKASRPALVRALIQGDLWAAYDFLSRDVPDGILKDAPVPRFHERQAQLRQLVAQLIAKLALTPDEIRALPDNYAAA